SAYAAADRCFRSAGRIDSAHVSGRAVLHDESNPVLGVWLASTEALDRALAEPSVVRVDALRDQLESAGPEDRNRRFERLRRTRTPPSSRCSAPCFHNGLCAESRRRELPCCG